MRKTRIVTLLWLILGSVRGSAATIDLVTPGDKVTIVYAPGDYTLDSLAANLLADDIQRITGYRPRVIDDIDRAAGTVIVIGSRQSALMRRLGDPAGLRYLEGKWECYQLKVREHPLKKITKALLITGSDARGTAYGVFDLSGRIGISPWY